MKMYLPSRSTINGFALLALTCAGLFTFSVPTTASANLILNGSFEAADLGQNVVTGWTVEPTSTAFVTVTNGHSGPGIRSLTFLGNQSGQSSISQITPTLLGENYTLSFAVADFTDGGGGGGMFVFWEGSQIFAQEPVLPGSGATYLDYLFSVTATTNGSELEVAGYRVSVDAFSLNAAAVPEPGTALFGLAMVGCHIMRRRRR